MHFGTITTVIFVKLAAKKNQNKAWLGLKLFWDIRDPVKEILKEKYATWSFHSQAKAVIIAHGTPKAKFQLLGLEPGGDDNDEEDLLWR